MRKSISTLICILIVFSCFTCLSGCDSKDFQMFNGNKANFILIRSQNAGNDEIATANYFRQAILDTHNIAVTYKQDNVKYKDGSVEVNVGVTNRPKSKEIYDELSKANRNNAMDYSIVFDGNIIYIVAASSVALQNAVDFFLSHFCGYKTSTIKSDFSYKYHFDGEGNNFKINGTKDIADYKIVTPHYNMSYLIGKEVDLLNKALMSATGANVNNIGDNEKETECEIIIGNAKRKNVPLPFNTDEYIIKAVDKKFYINGGSDLATSMGVRMLTSMVEGGEPIDSDLEYTGSASYDMKQNKTKDNFKLTWSDEFDSLNSSVWNISEGEYTHNSTADLDRKVAFSKSTENINVKNGILNLKATQSDKYYGVEMRTERSVWYKYGLLELSGKFNCTSGICAAFWVLGFSSQEVHGEFDIFECFGKQNQIKATPLSWVSDSANLGYKSGPLSASDNSYYTLPDGESFDDEYHTIGIDWDEKSLRWVYDGKVFFEIDTTSSEQARKTFNGAMQIILTLYAGPNVASLTGTPNETTDWENNGFNVDYVRLYQTPKHTLTLK